MCYDFLTEPAVATYRDGRMSRSRFCAFRVYIETKLLEQFLLMNCLGLGNSRFVYTHNEYFQAFRQGIAFLAPRERRKRTIELEKRAESALYIEPLPPLH